MKTLSSGLGAVAAAAGGPCARRRNHGLTYAATHPHHAHPHHRHPQHPQHRHPFSTTSPALSRIGRSPIRLPETASVELLPIQDPAAQNAPPRATTQAVVSGPLGSLSLPLHNFVTLKSVQSSRGKILAVSVSSPNERAQKAMWGTTRALLARMVEGVVEGHTLSVKLVGVGYRAVVEDVPAAEGDVPGAKRLNMKLGHSHPVIMRIPDGVEVRVPVPQRLILSGVDLQTMTQFAASIRRWRPPEPYNQKGIFVGDETIKKKEGKKR